MAISEIMPFYYAFMASDNYIGILYFIILGLGYFRKDFYVLLVSFVFTIATALYIFMTLGPTNSIFDDAICCLFLGLILGKMMESKKEEEK
jgi:hypothetical protein